MLLCEIKNLTNSYEAEIAFLKKHIKQYRGLVQLEIATLTNVVERIDEERDDFKEKIKMLKFILRTPRLVT